MLKMHALGVRGLELVGAANVRHPGLRTLQVMTHCMDVLKFNIGPRMSLQIHRSTTMVTDWLQTYFPGLGTAIRIMQ
ncbi:hypothetical protein D3C87_1567030 [compost metagenome]